MNTLHICNFFLKLCNKFSLFAYDDDALDERAL